MTYLFYLFIHSFIYLFLSLLAVVYECMKTIASVYPNPALVETAANKAGLFLLSQNNNLKYLGNVYLKFIYLLFFNLQYCYQ